MTLMQAIGLAALTRPNTFTNDQMTDWINDLEAAIQTDIWLRQVGDLSAPYVYSDDKNRELLVQRPFEKLYVHWLCAMISRHRDEPDRSGRSLAAFEELWGRYTRWFARTYTPALLTIQERETLYAAFTEGEGDDGGETGDGDSGNDGENAGDAE